MTAADLDALLKESERLDVKLANSHWALCDEARVHIRALSAALRAASADAGRYQWLREHPADFFVSQNIGHDWLEIYHEKLDAAIDAAMEPKP